MDIAKFTLPNTQGNLGKPGLFFTAILISTALIPTGCHHHPDPRYSPRQTDHIQEYGPVDRKANPETQALFYNLKSQMGEGILFGHEDDLAYGIQWSNVPGNSDVKAVTGAYPAVFGWDLGDIENGAEHNLDGVRFADMRSWIADVYAMGGVNTISWHQDHPVTGKDSWDRTPVIRTLLPGAEHHQAYLRRLDLLAQYLKTLETPSGSGIPVIFRPYHENTGNWFWWGRDSCTPAEFIAFWRMTVQVLRDDHQIHHLIYAYSPSWGSTADYEAYYPGDDVVDVIGLDAYNGTLDAGNGDQFIAWLEYIVDFADDHGKIAALTETGRNGIRPKDWFTRHLLNPIKSSPKASRIAYLLVWRNYQTNHCFAPYPGHPAERDFLSFFHDEFTVFQDSIPDLYRLPPQRNIRQPRYP